MQANTRAFELRSKLFEMIDEFKQFGQAIHATFKPAADDATFGARCEADSQADEAACALARIYEALPDLFVDAARDPQDQGFTFGLTEPTP